MKNFLLAFFICLQLSGSLHEALHEFARDESVFLIEPLAKGDSNTNYLVTQCHQKYFVKVGNESNEIFGVSMKQEWICSQFAALHGIAPKTVFYSPHNRVMITEYIETNGNIDFKDPNFPSLLCETLRKLHALQSSDFSPFNPFTCIDDYLNKSLEKGVNIPDVMKERLIPFVHEIELLFGSFMQSVPCHLDLNKGNMLLEGSKLWLIDWEYGGLSDPFLDLSFFIVSRDLDEEGMTELLRIYLDKIPTQEEITKLYAMCFLAEVRESLWSFLQSRVSNQEGHCVRGYRLLDKAIHRLEKLNELFIVLEFAKSHSIR